MTKSAKSCLVICTLVLATLLLQAGAAAACTEQCVRVGGLFCKECTDVGYYTGVTCENLSPCECVFTQNTCGLAASGIQAQTGLAAAVLPEKGAVCSTPTSHASFLNSLLQ